MITRDSKPGIMSSSFFELSEIEAEKTLRPQFLKDFHGQKSICENLKIFIESANVRGDVLDHILLYGPPGLGKTTIAGIVANELQVPIKTTSGPLLSKSGDLAALLTNLERKSVLFIDEIHRLNISVEEMLYSALEDFKIDILIGEGSSAKSIRLDLSPFTLIGATTRSGLISAPLRDRFGIPFHFDFYSVEDLANILNRSSKMLQVEIDAESRKLIAKRSRGTARIALRLLRRVRDFATISNGVNFGVVKIEKEITIDSLERLNVDNVGLDSEDLKYLKIILDFYSGGPVGLETISSAMSEESGTVEEIIEPYLIQIGFIQKTPRGRVVTEIAKKHLRNFKN